MADGCGRMTDRYGNVASLVMVILILRDSSPTIRGASSHGRGCASITIMLVPRHRWPTRSRFHDAPFAAATMGLGAEQLNMCSVSSTTSYDLCREYGGRCSTLVALWMSIRGLSFADAGQRAGYLVGIHV